MKNNFFDPANLTVSFGDTVRWNNAAGVPARNHTSTANLFNKWNEFVNDGQSSSAILFNRAGAYAYRCTIHPSQMKGTVRVRMGAMPSTGTDEATIFTIRVATASAPSGFQQDIQMRKGSNAFAFFRSLANTAQTTTFDPTSPGRYQFRSRLRRVSDGVATPYSPALTINVN